MNATLWRTVVTGPEDPKLVLFPSRLPSTQTRSLAQALALNLALTLAPIRALTLALTLTVALLPSSFAAAGEDPDGQGVVRLVFGSMPPKEDVCAARPKYQMFQVAATRAAALIPHPDSSVCPNPKSSSRPDPIPTPSPTPTNQMAADLDSSRGGRRREPRLPGAGSQVRVWRGRGAREELDLLRRWRRAALRQSGERPHASNPNPNPSLTLAPTPTLTRTRTRTSTLTRTPILILTQTLTLALTLTHWKRTGKGRRGAFKQVVPRP